MAENEGTCSPARDSLKTDTDSTPATEPNEKNHEPNPRIEDSNDKTENESNSENASKLKDNKSQNVENEMKFDLTITQDSVDGTDSGVEVVRALSSNGSNSDRFTPGQSCGSSLVSCYSEPEGDRGSECGSESSNKSRVKKIGAAGKPRGKTLTTRVRKISDYDARRTSESCSETSSTYEAQTSTHSSHSNDFNRNVANRLNEVRKTEPARTSTVRRTDSSARTSQVRSQSNVRTSTTTGVKPATRSSKTVKTNKLRPDNDDGRWPSSAQKATTGARSRGQSVVDTSRSKTNGANVMNAMSSSTISANSMTSSYGSGNSKGEVKSNALEKYGTLPRRPKKKAEQLEVPVVHSLQPRSSSVSREPSLNRAATLRRQQSKEKEGGLMGKFLPPYPRGKKGTGKTVIYHEVSVQTAVTSEDVANALAGIAIPDRSIVAVVEKANKAIQTEGKERMKKIEDSYLKQCEELEKEKKENERLKSEKKKMTVRICKMLGCPDSNFDDLEDCGLSQLEQHLQVVGLTVIREQEELAELRNFKTVARRDLEKSFAAQKNLLQQQQEIEAEYMELQEFLHAEKTALSESLHDSETEVQRLKAEVRHKDALLEQQQAECKHLVRICEQRRQEILSLEAKLTGLEQRSRDVLLQQGAAVSGAAVALSGLGARLDSLVEQLASSYNVSEKDLEDVIFHNEAYSRSQSEDNSPDYPPSQPAISDLNASPKRGASFLQAILGAIKNATQSPFASGRKSPLIQTDQNSDSFGLFDSDVEPCLVLETVMEEDDSSSLPNLSDFGNASSRSDSSRDEKTDETVTTMPQFENKNSGKLCHSDSLQNLSAAILARQQVERNEKNKSPDSGIPMEVNSLVDQVIDVDNLVTKLLKVLRIVQIENDNCVDQLHDERSDLIEKLQQEQIYRRRTEENLQRLQNELKEARSQLSARIAQLEEAKSLLTGNWRTANAESERQYATIDNALETLHSMQDIVNQYPPLAKLQQDLEECNFRTASGDDLNANSASNGNIDNAVLKDVNKHNGAVITTAI